MNDLTMSQTRRVSILQRFVKLTGEDFLEKLGAPISNGPRAATLSHLRMSKKQSRVSFDQGLSTASFEKRSAEQMIIQKTVMTSQFEIHDAYVTDAYLHRQVTISSQQ
ncbi:hypothetical protein KIN20_032682 [Parelaphostrongylus tenuis]|uniref:Uncharacterized protein n=1 Tax=Parelaphostrongylus tenuis TaxID=148309 RepID=A0AAD5R7F3_PARTN|nr:hypothetical protein KIN20_032682 [Parelaphostrongylus tenuis]